MPSLPSLLASLACAAALLAAGDASAQATRTWVSGVGDDANPCSRTAPCKTFAGAISKTAANGIINVLDPGGFGAVTITKSITIEGQGAFGGVLASLTNGININGAGIAVVLRNLSIEGAETGLIGVNYLQGAQLTIEKCRIFGFRGSPGVGIRTTAAGYLTVKDTTISDSTLGVVLQPPTGEAMIATLDEVLVQDTATAGVQTGGLGYAFVTINRSTITNNAGHGVDVASGLSYVNLVDSMVSFNGGNGVRANVAGGWVSLSGSALLFNIGQISYVGGVTMLSDSTNRIIGNTMGPNSTYLRK